MRIKDTHFAFLGIKGLTIPGVIESLSPDSEQLDFHYGDAKNIPLKGRWHVLHIGAVPKSTNCSVEEQMQLLPETYELPQFVTGFVGNLLLQVNGISIDRTNVRCRGNMGEYGRHLCVSRFDQKIKHPFLSHWYGRPCPNTGIAAALKVPKKF
jgi:hypothetical protein